MTEKLQSDIYGRIDMYINDNMGKSKSHQISGIILTASRRESSC